MQEASRHTLRQAPRSAAPAWLSDYDLPGLSERIAARDAARTQVEESNAALAEQEEAVGELDRFRSLLWQEGRNGLEQPVRDALALLGFRVAPQEIDTPAQLDLEAKGKGRRVALLEVEALKAIQVSVDFPGGPLAEEIMPTLEKVAGKKSLIVTGPVTESELEGLIGLADKGSICISVALVQAGAVE